jgi:hypothetical protein
LRAAPWPTHPAAPAADGSTTPVPPGGTATAGDRPTDRAGKFTRDSDALPPMHVASHCLT